MLIQYNLMVLKKHMFMVASKIKKRVPFTKLRFDSFEDVIIILRSSIHLLPFYPSLPIL